VRSKEDPNSKIAPMLAGQEKQIDGDHFWALREVNLEVKQGEILGIIGKNGAGKSTLLKILSRVTAPSRGNIKIKGRIASLLEVGTGFHPELTGRENIFMNGAILGMSKREINAKLDEIIDFSGVEVFVDTPVKRYSSGMYVRLAFAVAAHLEPEILVIDEVLAVGDAEFQKKCLGKMQDVSREGRTVFFVSHNMGAVRNLCSRAIVMKDGSLLSDGPIEEIIDQYLSLDDTVGHVGEIEWDEDNAPSCEDLSLEGIRLLGPGKKVFPVYDVTKPIDVEIRINVKRKIRGMRMVLSLLTADNVHIFSSTNHNEISGLEVSCGKLIVTCSIPANLLNVGLYVVKLHVGQPGVKVLLHGKEYLKFSTEGFGGHGSNFSEKWPGIVAPKLDWTHINQVR